MEFKITEAEARETVSAHCDCICIQTKNPCRVSYRGHSSA